jgi:DNA-binding Xre family transcriptional regulator
MIRSESDYRHARERLEAEAKCLAEYAGACASKGFSPDEVAKLMEPLQSFHARLVEEVEGYERLRRGEFGELENLGGLGHLLIGLRIAKGITQRQLAERLGVSETMVSRDERNEYRGITVDRAHRVLDALGAWLVTRVQLDRPNVPGTAASR